MERAGRETNPAFLTAIPTRVTNHMAGGLAWISHVKNIRRHELTGWLAYTGVGTGHGSDVPVVDDRTGDVAASPFNCNAAKGNREMVVTVGQGTVSEELLLQHGVANDGGLLRWPVTITCWWRPVPTFSPVSYAAHWPHFSTFPPIPLLLT